MDGEQHQRRSREDQKYAVAFGPLDIFDNDLITFVTEARNSADPDGTELPLGQVETYPVVMAQVSGYNQQKSLLSLCGNKEPLEEPLIASIVDPDTFSDLCAIVSELIPIIVVENTLDLSSFLSKISKKHHYSFGQIKTLSGILCFLAIYCRKGDIAIQTIDCTKNSPINYRAFQNIKVLFPALEVIRFSEPPDANVMWVFAGTKIAGEVKQGDFTKIPKKPLFSTATTPTPSQQRKKFCLSQYPSISLDMEAFPTNRYLIALMYRQSESV